MSDTQTTPQGTQSDLCTQFLAIVQPTGATQGTTAPTQVDEQVFVALQAEFDSQKKALGEYAKTLGPIEKEIARDLIGKQMGRFEKSFTTAIKDKNEPDARDALSDYTDMVKDAKVDIPNIAKTRNKFRQQKDIFQQTDKEKEMAFWKDVAKIEVQYAAVFRTVTDLIRTANDVLGKNKNRNKDSLARVALRDRQFKAQKKEIEEWAEKGKLLAELIYISEGDASADASLAWFDAIRIEIEPLTQPQQQQVQQQQADPEWDAIVQDVTTKWGAFRDSKFDFSLRGPVIATGLYTQRMRDKLQAGNAYVIAGKRYEVGNSDSGGMSLKTEFPSRYQGYNSQGKWVKSFIYHLQSTH